MRFIAPVLLAASLAAPASAATITALNFESNVLSDAPARVADRAFGNNDGITQAFNEKSNVVFTSDMTLGGVDFAAGTKVDSHLLYHDRASGSEYITSNSAFSFDKKILAVVMLTSELNATHEMFGPTGIEYLSAYGWFGLETDERNEIIVNDFEIFTRMTVNNGFDAVRVLTVASVPVPAAGGLLLTALGGLAWARRRKS